jgi:TP901 family phage tail tape measure protein
MPQIQIGADYTKVQQGNNELVASLQQVNDRITSITQNIGVFNSAGVQIGSTIKGLTQDGKEFTAQMGLLDRAARVFAGMGFDQTLHLQSIAFKESTREVEKQTAAQKGLEAISLRVQRAFQYFVAYRAFNFITKHIEEGVEAANKLQIQLSLIRTISQDNQQTRGQFNQQIRGVSDKTGFDINDTAKAFYDTISNQVAKGPKTGAFVSEAANLARVTGQELPSAVNTLTSTINAYNLSADDAKRISAIWFRTIDEGRIVLKEVEGTIGRVNVLAENLGVKFEEVAATLAITTQKGFKTSDAMTLLTNLMIKLEKPTAGTKRLFDELGVSTGEEAVRLVGLTGIIKKMIDLVNSGKADVSDFFDEIRGRKQFAVFQQSQDEIEKFANKLKDTANTLQVYNEAIAIRGESNADYVNKKLNEFANNFKDTIGQKIIGAAAGVIEVLDKFQQAAAKIGDVSESTKAASIAFLTLTATFAITKYGAIALTATMGVLRSALVATMATFAAYGVIIAATYVASKYAFEQLKSTYSTSFGRIDSSDVEAQIARLQTLKRLEKEGQPNEQQPLNGADFLKGEAEKSYKGIFQILSQINVKNNQVLDDAKQKAKDAALAMKGVFQGYLEGQRQGVSEIRKKIEEVDSELKKSKKQSVSFRDTLDDIIFKTEHKYANDDFQQKQQLDEQRIAKLKQRAADLFKQATPEAVQEARHLYNEIGRIEEDQFNRRTEFRKKTFEADIAAGRATATNYQDPYDPNIQRQAYFFTADIVPLKDKLNKLDSERNALEEEYLKKLKATKTAKQGEVIKEDVRLKTLQDSFKAYDDFTPYDKSGKVKKEFQDKQGRFDPKKALDEIGKIENRIRAVAGGTLDERVALELKLADYRRTLIKEVNASDLAEYTKTLQGKLTADEESFKKKIDKEVENRKKIEDEQEISQKSLLEGVSIARGHGEALQDKIQSGFLGQIDLAFAKKNLEELKTLINQYQNAVKGAKDRADNIGGNIVYRKDDIDDIRELRNRIISQVQKTQKDSYIEGQPVVNGVSVNDWIDTTTKELDRLTAKSKEFYQSFSRQGELQGELDAGVTLPLQKIRDKFPEIAKAADDAAAKLKETFKDAAGPGMQPLFDRLQNLQEELKKLPGAGGAGGKVGAVVGGDDGVAYAASGGVAGFFPGQPRGVDRYPIWAAKDEFIVNAQSSRMFRPMLEAINSRRTPRYMAEGGVVGGDTNIGDITITVNGAATNNDTGRIIASKLTRELRRRNIRM